MAPAHGHGHEARIHEFVGPKPETAAESTSQIAGPNLGNGEKRDHPLGHLDAVVIVVLVELELEEGPAVGHHASHQIRCRKLHLGRIRKHAVGRPGIQNQADQVAVLGHTEDAVDHLHNPTERHHAQRVETNDQAKVLARRHPMARPGRLVPQQQGLEQLGRVAVDGRQLRRKQRQHVDGAGHGRQRNSIRNQGNCVVLDDVR